MCEHKNMMKMLEYGNEQCLDCGTTFDTADPNCLNTDGTPNMKVQEEWAKDYESELYEWSVKQAVRYETGQMSQDEFEQLEAIKFPFEHYKKEADKLIHKLGLKDES